jgi:hypothetical protein
MNFPHLLDIAYLFLYRFGNLAGSLEKGARDVRENFFQKRLQLWNFFLRYAARGLVPL